jgi:hypothetical protein
VGIYDVQPRLRWAAIFRARIASGTIGAVCAALVAGCATAPPANVENICEIFMEKDDWYDAAKESEERWGTPVHVQMSIIRQESTFVSDAKPSRNRLLGIIPLGRPSDAKGFAQALDSTWAWYKDDTGSPFAQRTDFDDAIDFVGWYTNVSSREAGISKWDPYNQYLAYHEGPTGWKRKTYRGKRWLTDAASRVDYRAREWGAQLKGCESDLERGWWIFG